MDDLRYLPQHSPRSDAPSATISSIVSPPRNGASRMPQQNVAHDTRSNLPRRFTTDSGRIPTLGSMTSQQSRGAEPVQEYGNVSAFLCIPYRRTSGKSVEPQSLLFFRVLSMPRSSGASN